MYWLSISYTCDIISTDICSILRINLCKYNLKKHVKTQTARRRCSTHQQDMYGKTSALPTQCERSGTSLSHVVSKTCLFINLETRYWHTTSFPVDLPKSEEIGETVLLSTKCDLLTCTPISPIHNLDVSSSNKEFINMDQRVYQKTTEKCDNERWGSIEDDWATGIWDKSIKSDTSSVLY